MKLDDNFYRVLEEAENPQEAPSIGVEISDDGYLLSKIVHSRTVTRVIDWKSLGITNKMIDEAARIGKDNHPDPDDEESMDRAYVINLCLPYNPKPDDRDVFVYYNDIQALSGTAGYMRIRDGYVWGREIVWRS